LCGDLESPGSGDVSTLANRAVVHEIKELAK